MVDDRHVNHDRGEKSVHATEILARMERAINEHDLDALADCFAEDYRCEVPHHPRLSFVGRDRVRANWTGLFAHVPDMKATVLQSVVDGDQVWSEWELSGKTRDGDDHLACGVAILRAHEGRFIFSRFYLDKVDAADPGVS
ncbi:nuclear transport factor 2 family protein [Nonomuraea glycinis]|jgi:ketosteroid isomerase-like protein|uniref:nuclear transport factor 2 family protein n=1 Tax=Nonomuraea glycinis TaxID=2047744 RepID=UPI002E12BD56|nr:nuclear transport factor 2 family protein [Nonomuraea glycinis]